MDVDLRCLEGRTSCNNELKMFKVRRPQEATGRHAEPRPWTVSESFYCASLSIIALRPVTMV